MQSGSAADYGNYIGHFQQQMSRSASNVSEPESSSLLFSRYSDDTYRRERWKSTEVIDRRSKCIGRRYRLTLLSLTLLWEVINNCRLTATRRATISRI